MKSSSRIHVGVVALVAVAVLASTWALARPNPGYTLIRCSSYTCPSPGVCENPYLGPGYCTQGKNGQGFGSSLSCCCCSAADSHNRWYHAE